MNLVKLNTAIAEAERFLERARAALEAHRAAVQPMPGYEDYEEQARMHPVERLHLWNPRENGAVRRSSMDLTRALADLRKPNN